MRVTVLAFANLRELMGTASREMEFSNGDVTVQTAWEQLVREFPALEKLGGSLRLAVNGALVDRPARLKEGDELALMPPFGGG